MAPVSEYMSALLPASVRDRLRPLAAGARLWRRRLSAQRAGLAIVYHATEEPAGDPSRELVASHGPARLAAQLRHVRDHYRPVLADELPAAVAARRRGGRFPVAITFDDDLACHAEVSAPALAEAGIAATFFLTGTGLEGPRANWWQSLQRAHDAGALDAETRATLGGGTDVRALAAVAEALPEPELERVGARLAELAGGLGADPGLGADQVRALAAAGHEIGFHTRRHVRLLGLGSARLEEAFREGREELEAACGRRLSAVAYPHGKADAAVADAARAAGFAVGFTGRPVAAATDDDPLLIGRLQPTYDGGGAFAMQLATALLDRARRS